MAHKINTLTDKFITLLNKCDYDEIKDFLLEKELEFCNKRTNLHRQLRKLNRKSKTRTTKQIPSKRLTPRQIKKSKSKFIR